MYKFKNSADLRRNRANFKKPVVRNSKAPLDRQSIRKIQILPLFSTK